MEPLKEQVSRILGYRVNGWQKTFEELDVKGFIDNRVIIQILIALCERVESFEDAAKKSTPHD